MLLIGVGAGLLIYFLTDEEAANLALEEMLQSKRYARELQRFGGKASVVFDDLMRWFDAGWHGRELGVTIAWLSAGISAVTYWFSTRFDPE